VRALAARAPRVGTLQLAAHQVANKFFEAMRVIELPLALFAGDAALVADRRGALLARRGAAD
jgi:hypothetical protein